MPADIDDLETVTDQHVERARPLERGQRPQAQRLADVEQQPLPLGRAHRDDAHLDEPLGTVEVVVRLKQVAPGDEPVLRRDRHMPRGRDRNHVGHRRLAAGLDAVNNVLELGRVGRTHADVPHLVAPHMPALHTLEGPLVHHHGAIGGSAETLRTIATLRTWTQGT